MTTDDQRPDTLNDVGVLKRREIEARIVAPLLERLGQEFGTDRVYELAREVVARGDVPANVIQWLSHVLDPTAVAAPRTADSQLALGGIVALYRHVVAARARAEEAS